MEQIRSEKSLNIPNILTVSRILLLPGVVWRFRRGAYMGALAFYLSAMLTEAFDGVIARRFNQITSLGKMLDPIADKLSLITLLCLFVADGQIPSWVLGIVLAKEMLLVAGGAIAFRRGIVSCALPIGKVTTVLFIVSMVARFLALKAAADLLLAASVILSLAALFWYAAVMTRKLAEYNTVSTK